MRVAFVTGRPAYYRVPVFERLSRRCDVDFLFTGSGSAAHWLEEHPEHKGSIRAIDASNSLRLARLLTGGRYDAVMLSLAGRAHLGAAAACVQIRRLPLVLWVGMWHYPRSRAHALARPLVRALLKRADAIVAYGPHVAAWIGSETGRTSNVIPFWNAVDTDHFRPGSGRDSERLRRELGFGDRAVFGFVGRLAPEKGVPVLLDAMSKLDDGVALAILGTGPERSSVESEISHRGLEDRVRLVGYVNQTDLPQYYASLDGVVIPSITTPTFREPWGLVANEAMGAGTPVIGTTAVGAVAGGLVVHEETGLVVSEGRADELADAMRRLASDGELRLRLGAAASAHVAKWSFDAAADSLARGIEIALQRRRRA